MIYKGAREAATEININCVGNDGWFAEEEAAEFISKRLSPLVEAAQQSEKMRLRKIPTPFGHDCHWCADCCERVENELRKALEDLI